MSAPTTIPISGKDSKVDYKIGAGAVTILAHSKWDITPKPNILDLPNSVDGRRRIAGLPDFEGTISCKGVDTASSVQTDLLGGVTADFNFYPDGVKKWGPYTLIVGDVKISNEVEGSYDLEVPVMLASGKTLPGGPS